MRGVVFLRGSSSRSRPSFFASPKKEGKERRPGRAVSAVGADSPVLLENRGRPELAPAAPSLRTCGADISPVFCDARRALREEKRLSTTRSDLSPCGQSSGESRPDYVRLRCAANHRQGRNPAQNTRASVRFPVPSEVPNGQASCNSATRFSASRRLSDSSWRKRRAPGWP